MKILVTGGCGLIGYNAARYFHNLDHDVEVMDNLERSSLLGHHVSEQREKHNLFLLRAAGIPVHLQDVSKEASFLRPETNKPYDAIIHMAGQCGVPTSIANPRRDCEVNLMGTFNVLEHARKHGSKVVFASTNKVYPIKDNEFFFDKGCQRWRFLNKEWDMNGFPVTQLPPASRTPYGWSKYSADLLCQEYYHTYGVKTGIFRMSCIYGPNQFGFEEQGWATWFVIAHEKNLPLKIYGDGNQVRDMLYVLDAVKAYEVFLNSEENHGVYNLGGGFENSVTLNECLGTLKQMYGRSPEVSYHDWRPCDQKVYVTDNSKIKSLGWTPIVSVKEGLQNVRTWVAENSRIF